MAKKQDERGYMLYAFEKALVDIFKTPKNGSTREIDKIINTTNGKQKKYLKELKKLVDEKGVDQIATWGFIQSCISADLLKDIYAFMVTNDKFVVNPENGKLIREK